MTPTTADPTTPHRDFRSSTATDDQQGTAGRLVTAITRPINRLLDTVTIDRVYGTAITAGDTTVVPVAEVRAGFGYGSGVGTEDENPHGEGAGGGAGAGVRMIPRGYLHITPDSATYRPIYDVGRLAIAGAIAGWAVLRLFRR
jgi:uncharacterized spore protein YtfJ